MASVYGYAGTHAGSLRANNERTSGETLGGGTGAAVQEGVQEGGQGQAVQVDPRLIPD